MLCTSAKSPKVHSTQANMGSPADLVPSDRSSCKSGTGNINPNSRLPVSPGNFGGSSNSHRYLELVTVRSTGVPSCSSTRRNVGISDLCSQMAMSYFVEWSQKTLRYPTSQNVDGVSRCSE